MSNIKQYKKQSRISKPRCSQHTIHANTRLSAARSRASTGRSGTSVSVRRYEFIYYLDRVKRDV